MINAVVGKHQCTNEFLLHRDTGMNLKQWDEHCDDGFPMVTCSSTGAITSDACKYNTLNEFIQEKGPKTSELPVRLNTEEAKRKESRVLAGIES